MRTNDVSYVESKTGESRGLMSVIVARNLKSKQKADTLAKW